MIYQAKKVMYFDGTIRTIKTPVKEKKIQDEEEAKIKELRNLNRRMKRLDKKKGKTQKNLPTAKRPEFLIFEADKQVKGRTISIKNLEEDLYRPFRKYNIPLEEKKILVDSYLKTINQKKCNVPKELLALAMLNIVDEVLERKNMTFFNWTFHVKDLGTWRKSTAAKVLKKKEYIEIVSRNCWLRTDKKFKRTDFYKERKTINKENSEPGKEPGLEDFEILRMELMPEGSTSYLFELTHSDGTKTKQECTCIHPDSELIDIMLDVLIN